jgi:hypothetical protein
MDASPCLWSSAVMRSSRSLREILSRTLITFPLLSGSGCPPPSAACGTKNQVVIIGGSVSTLPDGGKDCSACEAAAWDQFVDGCQAMTVNGAPAIACQVEQRCFTTGRRPASLLDGAEHTCHPAGAFFAESARLEAASIVAFRILARELRAHGAPEVLVRWSNRSGLEEVGHARITAALARRYGASPEGPRFSETSGIRSLPEVAVENVVEGSVREAFGVVVAAWQAGHAKDSVIARAMTGITRDEFRHAELASAVAEWAAARLSRPSRLRIQEARDAALAGLASTPMAPCPHGEVTAGLPTAEIHREFATTFADAMVG